MAARSSSQVKPAKPALLRRIIQNVRDQQLFMPGQHLLIAISGGPDSVALLSLLSRMASAWRLRLTAVHFNYRLRGEESDDDETFVSVLCREKGVPLLVRRPVLLKGKRQSSLQALARDVRYAAMKSIAYEIGADRIVVGHTANDQAETVLMWMLRGAGLTGLSGMPFVREALIVRPLLTVTRQEILEYLTGEGLPYRVDSSNESTRYRRNRIRKELVPVMEQIAPATVRLLQRQANLLREDERYLNDVVRALYPSLVSRDSEGWQRCDRHAFASIPVSLQRRIVRMMLSAVNPEGRASSAQTVEDVQQFMLTAGEGARRLLQHVELTREGEVVRIVSRKHKRSNRMVASTVLDEQEIPVRIPSTVHWSRTDQEIHVEVMPWAEAEPFLEMRSGRLAVFDADRFSDSLLIRSWKAGDRLYPRGMGGKSKKLQDLFMDWKVPRHERRAVPLLVAPEGVLWVIGRRQDERFLVGKDTSRCLVVTVKERSLSKGVR